MSFWSLRDEEDCTPVSTADAVREWAWVTGAGAATASGC